MPEVASAAVIVVGVTVKYGLLDESVRFPVKLVPVTVNVLEDVLSLTTLPKASDETLMAILGSIHVPVTVHVTLVAPQLMVMVAECEPVAVGL